MASGSSGNEGVTNFLKLQNLFGASTSQIYRSHFISVWNHYFGASSGEWQNTKDFVDKKFISGGIGKEIYDSCDEHEKRILRSGNISLWDLTLLLDVIKKLQNAAKDVASEGGIKSIKFLSEEKLDETKNLWDEVDYQSRIIVDYENYGNWMTKVVKALEENGMSKEKIVTNAFFLEKPAEETPELDDVGKLAEKLKQDGNLASGKKEFGKALKFYTDAIELDGLPDELLGTLYSNRSLCNIHMDKAEDAKFDAKCAMTLRPSWFRGYLRLGKVHEENDDFNLALQFYKLAEVLEPGNKEVAAAATKACKFKRDNNHFKTPNLGLQNMLNLLNHKTCRNPQQIEIDKELLRQGDPFMLYDEGERFENGDWGYPQDYKRAAEFYSKAASKGYATGIFKLATLTEEGKGVPKDVSKAFEMYKQVAAMPVLDEYYITGAVQNAAIFLAQVTLGFSYRSGEIVPRDLELAISWHKKALENGSELAPKYLGRIYLSKEKRDVPLAILHFMMGAHRGHVESIEELANFLHLIKNPEAQKWWKLAVHCGSSRMKQLEHLYMTYDLTPNFNPFEFRAEIKKRLTASVELGNVMKKFEDPKFSCLRGIWDLAFHKVVGISEEAERELCKAMKNI